MSAQTTTVGSDPRLVAACHAVAALAAAVCMIAGATSLLLLAFDLGTSGTAVSVIPLQADSAVGFLAGGLALALLQSSPINNWRRSAGAAAASVVVLIGLLGLGQTRGLLDPYVGRYVVSDATAVGMLLLGLALASIDLTSRRGRRVASLLVAPPLFVSLAAMLFFLYLEPDDEAGLWLTSAGPGASALFLVLSVGLLCARPDRGNMALATSRTTGGLIVRRLMPVALLLVPFGFWLRLEAERSGLYGPDYGVALMALANVILLGGVAWFGALYLDRLDARRRRAEASQQMSETRFEATFEQAAVGIALVAPDGNWLRVNEKLASILGYSTGEMSALTFRDITHADDIDADARTGATHAGPRDHFVLDRDAPAPQGQTLRVGNPHRGPRVAGRRRARLFHIRDRRRHGRQGGSPGGAGHQGENGGRPGQHDGRGLHLGRRRALSRIQRCVCDIPQVS